jgi:hypothetical protein
MKNTKNLLLTALSLVVLQSCSEDETIIHLDDEVALESSYNGTRLKTLSIVPKALGNDSATYTWKLGNEIVGNEKVLGFVSEQAGSYNLSLEIKTAAGTKTYTTTVNIAQETVTYSKHIAQVFDFLPAVGQFVNKLPAYTTGNSQTEMVANAAAALVGSAPKVISLGGFGGYVVFGFDHTIVNKPNVRDFKILGNGFAGSSEPGIIMVAYDKNKNGKPDEDEWYEIAGSEYKNPNAIKNYTITYQKPTVEDEKPNNEYIKWSDNQGNSGFKVKNSFHKQSYYPLWFAQNELKFTGTRLPDNYTDQSGNGTYWTGKQYAFGYADNASNDSEDSNIDIDWAVDKNGNPVKLMGIDFIKVYTAINQEAGWLGEISTEVGGAYDLHIK